MSIAIYTYKAPYQLNREPYWDEIRTCPYFCAAQTLVNGLRTLYTADFVQGRVTTVQNLLAALFKDWESTAHRIKQHAAIDNAIANQTVAIADPALRERMERAFLFNRAEVFDSLRVMAELDVDVNEISRDQLTPEQDYIVALFQSLCAARETAFDLSCDFDEAFVDAVLLEALRGASQGAADDLHLDADRIVIHGVHQFTPLMLRAIERIAAYKKVILLFQYQEQYAAAYQTWVDIYTAFDRPITASAGAELRPNPAHSVSYEGNVLADSLGQLINGNVDRISAGHPYEIMEFDNMTEFAAYVARAFEQAGKSDPENPMRMMQEQIYAADSSANNILKMYFPEQFGERQFLDYPLGHFFLAVANMWDAEKNEMVIADAADIKECLEAGILREDYPGQLSAVWGQLAALFEGCTTPDEMIRRLQRLRKRKKYLSDPAQQEYVRHISYYTVSRDAIDQMERALTELKELAAYFYEDFEQQPHNFRAFYQRLKAYLQQDVLDEQGLGEEFADIIRRVLERLEEVEHIDESASFSCLKATMSIYLVQETKPGKSAHWIVRDFEQIDGDILRSGQGRVRGKPVTYHFACLSDEDMCGGRARKFPWPLTDAFFEVAQEPVDWKYQVYVKARKEYRNYKRYALLYGLQFNRARFRLSYVRRSGEGEREPYYLLQLLGARRVRYEERRRSPWLADVTAIRAAGAPARAYEPADYYRWRLCRYRFLLESIAEGTTIYKEPFLLVKYFEIILENQIKEELQGSPAGETIVADALSDTYETLSKYFPFVSNLNRMDVLKKVRARLPHGKMPFPILKDSDRAYMRIREQFIYKKLTDAGRPQVNILKDVFAPVSDAKIAETLAESALAQTYFHRHIGIWCQYCANHELCAASYKG